MIIMHAKWKLQGENVRLRVFVGNGYEEFRPVGTLMLKATEFIMMSQGQMHPEYEEDTDDAP